MGYPPQKLLNQYLKKRGEVLRAISLFIIAVTFNYSCGDDKASNESSKIVGDWESGCNFSGQYFRQKSISLDEKGRYEYLEASFEDGSCQVSPKSVLFSTGSFLISNATVHKNLDLKIESIAVSAKDQSLTNSFNDNAYCGFNNWSVNESKSVVGMSCSDNSGEVIFADNAEIHMQIVSFSDDYGQLTLGVDFLQKIAKRVSDLSETPLYKISHSLNLKNKK